MGTVPLRLEAILLMIYLVLNFTFVVVMVDWWRGFSDKMFQLKYAAGHLAVMNTPGLVLSAGRNNPLVQMLGLHFDTFNFMHRWVGRVIAANAVVHMSAVLANQAYMRTYDLMRLGFSLLTLLTQMVSTTFFILFGRCPSIFTASWRFLASFSLFCNHCRRFDMHFMSFSFIFTLQWP
jgi:hypothetical protein